MDNNRKLMDHMVQFATKYFNDSGTLMPMWSLVGADNEMAVFLTPFTNDEEKDLTSQMIRSEATKRNVVRIGFMSETWIAKAPEGMAEEAAKHIVPSEQPDRGEAIYLVVEDRSGTLSGMIEIQRDAEGKPSLQPYKENDAKGSVKGRFANFFKNKAMH